ncbi:helix-turn-helix transcriptional regulator [Mesorhizobium sp. BR1-1-9]|uniref:helix-turn-helix transcriptional regulator n=1 Tax=Mesorhizobium sp. BR1-1-9 TaxID=2876646 RepID=UPI001CD0972A|nr:helix-turn-helix transcriptional regulator [Mesorhizobium sp. BR1-1-9]MBZ9872957.1 helix-turn-helix transcriptional regulator [Mesorhizobium sp. BR1-1-9]
MDAIATGEITQSGTGERQLVVLVALGDAARAERLSASLAATDDLLPVTPGSSEAVDVAIVDDTAGPTGAGTGKGDAVPAATARVLLSSQAGLARPQGQVFAVLPMAADAMLIAAAARLAAAGYRVFGDSGSVPGRRDDFHGGDVGGDGLFDEEHPDEHAARPALSPREAEVLALLAEGAPNKVIARRLDISVHTAKFHVAAILIKLGAANRTDAIAIAMRQGLVLV